MRVAGFVPSKLNSERVPKKNIRPLGGQPLVNYALRTLNGVRGIDETFVFASEPAIREFILPGIRYTYLRRPPYLDTQEARAQDFIGEFLKAVQADIIVLLHITSPFITADTVEDCLSAVLSGRHDSACAALELKRFAWYKGSPLNYDAGAPTPRTQDLSPVMVEQSGLYVFTRALFENGGRRISERAYFRTIGHFEGHDIDTEEDFALAELMVSRNGRAHGGQ